MDETEEQALVRSLRQADEQAWARFCREYCAPLWDFVEIAFGCGREQSEEIVQRTFVRCVRSIGTFDPARGRLLPWLKAVARNEARSHLRGDSRGRSNPPPAGGPEGALDRFVSRIDRNPLPDELLARQDTQMLVRECLAELSERQAGALIAKYVDGLSVSAIATRLCVSEKAAESLMSRSRESFKRAFLAKLAGKPARRTEIFE